eukprot:Gb_02656 [translate_table: standard]
MEGRDSSGHGSFNAYFHRGSPYNPSSVAYTGAIVTPSAIRHMPSTPQAITIASPTPNNNNNNHCNSSSPFHSETPTAIVPHHQQMHGNAGMRMGMGMGMGVSRSEPMKRKRGRPRKYGNDVDGFGNMGLGLSSGSPSHSLSDKRGRPSGKKAQISALGSVGQGFAPHVITIAAGEDVSKKIMAFWQHGPWAVCVLSANGAISNVTLRQPAMSGGTVTYEGRFEILSLSGSFLLTEVGGTRTRTGGLSVSLAGPDGRVVGGAVAGLLMAASPVQVVVGAFLTDTKKIFGQVGQGEPYNDTLPASVSECPTSPVALQSRTDACGGTSTGQGAHVGQNTGEGSYTLQPQVLNMMSLQSIDWSEPHFEAETRSNNTEMTGGKVKNQNDDSGSYKADEEEEHKDNESFGN